MPSWSDPPLIPYISLPDAPDLPIPVLEVPRAELPNYKPLVVPPNTLQPPPGIEGINTGEDPPQEEQNLLLQNRLHNPI